MLDEFGDEKICGNEASCGENQFCGKRIMNPNYDVTNFDNIFWALLAIFQCVTLEGWSDMMVLYQKVYTYYVFLFFVPLVFIGAFFLLNLTLAVINTSFNAAQDRIKQSKKEKEDEIKTIINNKKNEDEEQVAEMKIQAINHDEDKTKLNLRNVGVNEFFIAQKAGRRLRDFAKNWKAKKRRAEQE